MQYILSDPDLKDPVPIEYLSHKERYDAELKKACLLVQKMRKPVPSVGNYETLRYSDAVYYKNFLYVCTVILQVVYHFDLQIQGETKKRQTTRYWSRTSSCHP